MAARTGSTPGHDPAFRRPEVFWARLWREFANHSPQMRKRWHQCRRNPARLPPLRPHQPGALPMSIPQAAYPAPFNTTRASHVVLTVKDLGASRAFYVDAMGFVVSDETADTIYLRGLEEACHHSLVLKRASDASACERIGLRVYTDDDLDVA